MGGLNAGEVCSKVSGGVQNKTRKRIIEMLIHNKHNGFKKCFNYVFLPLNCLFFLPSGNHVGFFFNSDLMLQLLTDALASSLSLFILVLLLLLSLLLSLFKEKGSKKWV